MSILLGGRAAESNERSFAIVKVDPLVSREQLDGDLASRSGLLNTRASVQVGENLEGLQPNVRNTMSALQRMGGTRAAVGAETISFVHLFNRSDVVDAPVVERQVLDEKKLVAAAKLLGSDRDSQFNVHITTSGRIRGATLTDL